MKNTIEVLIEGKIPFESDSRLWNKLIKDKLKLPGTPSKGMVYDL